jgi:hypothetical protein
VSGGLGTVAGAGIAVGTGFAAQAAGEQTRKGSLWAYDKLFGDDADIKSIKPTDNSMTPEAFKSGYEVPAPTPSSPYVGVTPSQMQQQMLQASLQNGSAQFGNVDSQGMSTITLRVGNASGFIQSGVMRNNMTNTGLSGGR